EAEGSCVRTPFFPKLKLSAWQHRDTRTKKRYERRPPSCTEPERLTQRPGPRAVVLRSGATPTRAAICRCRTELPSKLTILWTSRLCCMAGASVKRSEKSGLQILLWREQATSTAYRDIAVLTPSKV